MNTHQKLIENTIQESLRTMQLINEISSRYVHPIYQKTNNEKPTLIGSGFIINLNGKCFFITAAHVMIHHSSSNPLFYFASQKQRVVLNYPTKKSNSKKPNHADDRIDIAVIELTPEHAKPYLEINKQAITQEQITNSFADTLNCRLIISGYPLTKNKPDTKNKNMNPQCFTWIGHPQPDFKYKKMGLDISNNILIKFSKRDTLRHDGFKGSMFPDPRGISGAPVWRADGYRNEAGNLCIERLLLTGVLIEWIKTEHSLIATNIKHVLDMIDSFPKNSQTI